MAKYFITVPEGLQLADTNLWDAEFAHTGRKVRGTEGYALATDWALSFERDELIKHPAAEEFRSIIPFIPCVESSLVCFRVRGFLEKSPRSDEMGPPPLNMKTSDGRYNVSGEHVLYLSDSEDGVIREFRAQRMKGIPYIQRYCLPVDKLRIADLTKIPPDHFVSHVFSKAEECNVGGRGQPGYNFSQVIAEFVKDNFNGMRVPGVQGLPGEWYTNIVIFHPFPNWPDWLESGFSPYRFIL